MTRVATNRDLSAVDMVACFALFLAVREHYNQGFFAELVIFIVFYVVAQLTVEIAWRLHLGW